LLNKLPRNKNKPTLWGYKILNYKTCHMSGVTECKDTMVITPKLTTGYDPEPFQSNLNFHNLFPEDPYSIKFPPPPLSLPRGLMPLSL
jgi:hypothetical protein